jgi:hypothetical protein
LSICPSSFPALFGKVNVCSGEGELKAQDSVNAVIANTIVERIATS